MKQVLSKRPQGGFALTELLLTIGIIALVLGAIAAVAITTGASQAAQNEARIIDSAANKVRSIYASRPDYAGLDLASSIAFEIWPTATVNAAGDTVFNSWGGAVAVNYPGPGFSGGDANRQFSIDWPNVSIESCADLATAQTSAIGIQVERTTVYERGVTDPIDLAAVAANCVDQATITFVYGKVN